MAQNYVTRDGDMLDWICWKHYGRTVGAVEAVLAANRDLATLGPVYTAGVKIVLPDLAAADTTAVIRLWN